MNDSTLKRRLTRIKPRSPDAAMRYCGLTLKWIDAGAYRDIYEIVGTPYIIKFPHWIWRNGKINWLRKHVIHAQYEMNALIRMRTRKRWKFVRAYLPFVLWGDWDTGVIVMEKYDPLPATSVNRKLIRTLNKMIRALCNSKTDIVCRNCGLDSEGKIKLIDLGWIEE